MTPEEFYKSVVIDRQATASNFEQRDLIIEYINSLNQKEVWVPTASYPNDYLISNLGNLYSNHYKTIMSPKIAQDGYLRIRQKRTSGEIRLIVIYRELCKTFLGKRPIGYEVTHYPDPNKLNNNLSNLCYRSHVQNCYDKGEDMNNDNVKLTRDDVVDIKDMLISGFSIEYLSELYDVTYQTIYKIRINKSWNEIGPDVSSMQLNGVRRKNLTITDKEYIKGLRHNGVSVAMIAARYNLKDHKSIYNILKDAMVVPNLSAV